MELFRKALDMTKVDIYQFIAKQKLAVLGTLSSKPEVMPGHNSVIGQMKSRLLPRSPSVVSKATAVDSDEATNFSSAVASDTTLGLLARINSGLFVIRPNRRNSALTV
jgi:hypothetical protein